jgi:hypothetical protein
MKMHEVISFQPSRDWFKIFALALLVLGSLCTFLVKDYFWMASGFAVFGGWWLAVNESTKRILQIAVSIAAGMTLACILDAISFTEPFHKRGLHNLVPGKVSLYGIAAFAGALLGLGSSFRK